jgi:hypothetical protein
MQNERPILFGVYADILLSKGNGCIGQGTPCLRVCNASFESLLRKAQQRQEQDEEETYGQSFAVHLMSKLESCNKNRLVFLNPWVVPNSSK